jgi:hypothetical protein
MPRARVVHVCVRSKYRRHRALHLQWASGWKGLSQLLGGRGGGCVDHRPRPWPAIGVILELATGPCRQHHKTQQREQPGPDEPSHAHAIGVAHFHMEARVVLGRGHPLLLANLHDGPENGQGNESRQCCGTGDRAGARASNHSLSRNARMWPRRMLLHASTRSHTCHDPHGNDGDPNLG